MLNLVQSLPPRTAYSKHLPLRFQFLRQGTKREHIEGVYRVVKVPLNYTFVHLKFLVAYLFGGEIHERTDGSEDGEGHLFEVKKRVGLYGASYKPGEIKSGETWVKLSSTRDPYLYRGDLGGDDGDENDVVEEDEKDDRRWEAEEDFTINHAWPKGGVLERAIVYVCISDFFSSFW